MLKGEECFTGIVLDTSSGSRKFFRLDDPDGELEGPNHEMAPEEFLSQMSLYDDSKAPKPRPAKFLRATEVLPSYSVRAGDSVEVRTPGGDSKWVCVLSVTPEGVVAGHLCGSPDDRICFGDVCVVSVQRGGCW